MRIIIKILKSNLEKVWQRFSKTFQNHIIKNFNLFLFEILQINFKKKFYFLTKFFVF